MKRHTRIYMQYFGYDISDFIPCEIPNCGDRAVDVCHIDARGMGGSNQKDNIENLMAKCRFHHDYFRDKKQFKTYLKQVHKSFMERNKAA